MSEAAHPNSSPVVPGDLTFPKPPRPKSVKFLAWAIWYVGAHIPLVTLVMLYFLFVLCWEEHSMLALKTWPGKVLIGATVASLVSTVAFMLSGLDVYRRRNGRAVAWMVFSLVTGVGMCLPLFLI